MTVEGLFRVLSDHAGHPEGVCRHDDETVAVYHRHPVFVVDGC